jgi:hypothetical protein
MKFVTLVAALVATGFMHTASANKCDELDSLTSKQQVVLQKSYAIGKKHDLGETLAAVALVESTAGKNLQNGKSYGVYMVSLGNVIKREGGDKYEDLTADEVLRKTPTAVKKRYIKRLKTDLPFNAKHAIEELRYWQDQTNTPKQMWAAYNGGWNATTKSSALRYSSKIQKNIRLFRQCEYFVSR